MKHNGTYWRLLSLSPPFRGHPSKWQCLENSIIPPNTEMNKLKGCLHFPLISRNTYK